MVQCLCPPVLVCLTIATCKLVGPLSVNEKPIDEAEGSRCVSAAVALGVSFR